MMPDMDGIEALNHIRKDFPTMPIVALTAQDQDTQKDILLSIGFNDFLSKPFKEMDLLQIVAKTALNTWSECSIGLSMDDII